MTYSMYVGQYIILNVSAPQLLILGSSLVVSIHLITIDGNFEYMYNTY